MIDWTEQQEQEMIARAKAGDPEANYQLSLWALERSEEEPDEIRWNRLAAKCLVKAAQAGHGPAQERLQALLEQNAPPVAPAKRGAPANQTPPAEPVPISGGRRGARHAQQQEQKPARRGPRIVPKEEVYDEDEEEPEEYEDEEEEDERPARRKKAKAGGKKAAPFSNWGEAQWRRMERICIGICALLIVAIAVMFFTGRRRSGAGQTTDPTVPQAGQVTEVTPEPEVEPYPDDTVKAAIQASDIEVQPADLDYVKAATTATVTVGTGNKTLRLRSGPNTNYHQLAEMPNGSAVDVFAKKDDWALVLYQGDDGPLYGWCSSSYLITTSGSVG